MDIETLKTEINTEVQKRAEELAKDKIRNLTLAKKRAENLVKTAQAEIVELDKKIAEVKIEDFEELALRDVRNKEVSGDWQTVHPFLRHWFDSIPFGTGTTGGN